MYVGTCSNVRFSQCKFCPATSLILDIRHLRHYLRPHTAVGYFLKISHQFRCLPFIPSFDEFHSRSCGILLEHLWEELKTAKWATLGRAKLTKIYYLSQMITSLLLNLNVKKNITFSFASQWCFVGVYTCRAVRFWNKYCKTQVHNVFQCTMLLYLSCFYFLSLFSTLESNRRRAWDLYLNTDGMMAQHLLQLASSYVTEFIFNISFKPLFCRKVSLKWQPPKYRLYFFRGTWIFCGNMTKN